MSGHTRKENICLRSNSICASPESELLNYVKRNNVERLSSLIKSNKELLNRTFEHTRSILQVALSDTEVTPETIETLINLGADLYYSNKQDEGWQPLHYAARSIRSDVLKIVIKNLKKEGDINATANGNTALHVLIKYDKEILGKNAQEAENCAKLLLQAGINVNLTDKKGRTAILWAAIKNYKNLVNAILEHSCMPVNLDIPDYDEKIARDIILRKNLYDGTLPEAFENNEEPIITASDLFQLLKIGKEDAFVGVNFDHVELINGESISRLVDPSTNLTLLQTSCEYKLPKAVKRLLELNVDPNVTNSDGEAPIEIVARQGRWDLFQMLLEQSSPTIQVPKSVLITLLKRIDYGSPGNCVDYEKCWQIMMTKVNLLDVHQTDKLNNSPLHYAVQYAGPQVVKKLLDLGASLGSKNDFGIMPVEDIEPLVLEQHLDDCVEFELSKKTGKEDFVVTFNYHTIIPPVNKSESNQHLDTDVEGKLNGAVEHELVAETEVIAYMSESAEFKHLLMHPVIVSFLFMKWQRISWLYYVNLIFYIIFSFSLVVYIFASYTNPYKSDITPFVTFLVYSSKAIFYLTFLILVLRELFQMAIAPSNYFKCFENYLEIILIFCTGSILCDANVLPGNNSIDDTKKILSAVSILLASFELVLMVGKHPKLSTNVLMLRTVSFNFFKFLMWYSLLILAFALSFYILFSETTPPLRNETAGDQEGEDLFSNPGKSVFKTIVMLTGEFDASSMNFQRFPITSKIIFSLFIFMIAIILLNLLNGLAVSDTHIIRSNAELMGHITRAQHIRYVESMVLGNVLPSKLLRTLKNLYCCFPVDGSYNFSIFKPLAQRVCLFPDFLEDYKLSICPDEGGKIKLPKDERRTSSQRELDRCYGCHNIYLDKATVKRTKTIIHKRREKEISLEEINVKLDNFITKFDKYVKENGKRLN